MALTLFAVNNGYFDDVDVKKALSAEKSMRDYIEEVRRAVKTMEEKKDLSGRREGAEGRHRGLEKNATFYARYQGNPDEDPERAEHAQDHQGDGDGRRLQDEEAQERMRQARPYGEKIRNVAAHISHANPEYRHPFLVDRDSVKRVGIIVVTTDKGLCGALNTNLLRWWCASTSRGRRRARRSTSARSAPGPGFHAAAGANIVSQRSSSVTAHGQADRRAQGDARRLHVDRFDRLMIVTTASSTP